MSEDKSLTLTEQKKLADDLRAERDLNRRYLEVASVMFVVINANQEVELINRKGCEILGYEPKELLGRNWFDKVITAAQAPAVKKVFEKLIAGDIEPVEYFENNIMTRSGQKRLIAWTNNYIKNDQNQITSIIACGREITEQRQAEKQIIEERNKLEAVMAALDDGITVQDLNFKVIYQNRHHQQLQGSQKGEFCFKAYQQKEQICQGCLLKKSFKDGQVHRREVEATGKDGETIYMEVTASPVNDATGAIVAGVEAVRDISQRKKLEIEAQRARNLESLGIFAGGIAHDFNNLLTAILGNLTLAQHRFLNGGDFSSMFDSMGMACDRAQQLTKQLMTFSKGGAPVIGSASIKNIVINSTNFMLTGSNTKMTSNFPDDILDVEVDAGQISQVIQNLTKNADQSTPDGGIIHLTAANTVVTKQDDLPLEPGPYVLLTFTDSGCGIEDEVLKKIFDPYFTTKPSGNGLGLAISFSIIKKHKGHIAAHSTVGRGTVFEIWLPATEKTAKESPSQPTTELETGQGHILVMDDEKMLRDLSLEMLIGLGYTADTAWDGRQMLEMYKQAKESGQPYDLVIVDLTIQGGMGGQEAIGELLRMDAGAKAMVASGYCNDPIMANHQEYGFCGVIVKPYTMNQLGEALKGILTSTDYS